MLEHDCLAQAQGEREISGKSSSVLDYFSRAEIPSPRLVVPILLTGSLLCLIYYYCYYYHGPEWYLPKSSSIANYDKKGSSESTFKVPFVVLQDPDWRILAKSLLEYQTQCQASLLILSDMLTSVQDNGNGGGAARVIRRRLQERIQRLSGLYEHNEQILRDHVLIPFTTTKAVSNRAFPVEPSPTPPSTDNESAATDNTFAFCRRKPLHQQQLNTSGGYNSAVQILTHWVRDWSIEGRSIRTALYDWCGERLDHCQPPSHTGASSVLVPGAGVGRLAFDLAQMGYVVHAVESSLAMAAAAAAVMVRPSTQWTIYPYANDLWSDEVDSQQRYASVQIPDVQPQKQADFKGHLSFTVGDVLETLQAQDKGSYHAVVTCFFMDAVPNVLDMMQALWDHLLPNGLWIHVGPLHWHGHAELRLTVDDLHEAIQAAGWQVLEWQVNSSPLAYRSPLDLTLVEAYRPLRFVARKKPASFFF